MPVQVSNKICILPFSGAYATIMDGWALTLAMQRKPVAAPIIGFLYGTSKGNRAAAVDNIYEQITQHSAAALLFPRG